MVSVISGNDHLDSSMDQKELENFSENSIQSSKCEDIENIEESADDGFEEAASNTILKKKLKNNNPQIKDKEFYKAMQKIKERNTTNKPPKKPASAYILFQKEVSTNSVKNQK